MVYGNEYIVKAKSNQVKSSIYILISNQITIQYIKLYIDIHQSIHLLLEINSFA